MNQDQIIEELKNSDLPEEKKQELLSKISQTGLTDEIRDEILDLINLEIDKTDVQMAESSARVAALEGKSVDNAMQDAAKTINNKFTELENEGKKAIADSEKKMKEEAAKTQAEIDQAAADAIKSSIK